MLETANIKLGALASNVVGVSGRRMLEAIRQGESDPRTLAELAKGRPREKLPALRLALAGVLLLTRPSTGPVTAAAIIAEIGTDMSRVILSTFASLSVNSAKHLSADRDRPFASRRRDRV